MFVNKSNYKKQLAAVFVMELNQKVCSAHLARKFYALTAY